MAKRAAGISDQMVKLIVGAGQASPSPPVGPALGSKGIKSMDFCKVRSPRSARSKVFSRLLYSPCSNFLAALLTIFFPRNSTHAQLTSSPAHHSPSASRFARTGRSTLTFAHPRPRGCYSTQPPSSPAKAVSAVAPPTPARKPSALSA